MFVLLLLLSASACAHAFTCKGDALVCGALGDLYTSTNGGFWTANKGWREAATGQKTHYCDFYGVKCSGGGLWNL